ncbi:hypothetical protein WA158_002950 [Blastocystis sp. Blastoise]
MVKSKLDLNYNKIDYVQNDLIHYEQLIYDLVGILNTSISFCAHSRDVIDRLILYHINSNELESKKDHNPSEIIQKLSSIHESETVISSNDSEYDFIRFGNNGIIYSFPKSIISSLKGSYIYEQIQEDQRTVDGTLYLDYSNDETLAPLLMDSLMNKKINLDAYTLEEQLELLDLFEYCNLPLPVELMDCRERRDTKKKKYEEGDVSLIINGKSNYIIKEYLIKNGLWNNYVMNYDNGFVDYNFMDESLSMNKKYEYIEYIYEYMKNNIIDIETEKIISINKELLEKEMCDLFGDEGRKAVKKGILPFKYFNDTKILVNKVMEAPLVNWLGKEKKWKLLFRASEHDYSAEQFHKYCDYRGETLVLIKHIGHNNHMNIFGGYTDHSWDSANCWKSYSKKFLFTLSNEHGIPPTQYEYIDHDKNCGIFCGSLYGPSFGGGCDICIYDQCHTNTKSYCNAHSYSEKNTPQKSSLFVNTNDEDSINNFKIEDYEVWGRYY